MYPSYSAYSYQGWTGAGQLTQQSPDDPGAASPQYWAMAHRWQVIGDVLAGTSAMRANAVKYLPKAVQ